MAYGPGWRPTNNDYQALEREAFRLLYRHPPGTTFDELRERGEVLSTALQPFPHLEEFWATDPMGRWHAITSAKPEDEIVLVGSRLTLRMMSEDVPSVPGASVAPEVHFGDVVVTADLADQTTLSGGPARYLKVRVPPTAISGWVWVRAHGLAGNPVWLEVT